MTLKELRAKLDAMGAELREVFKQTKSTDKGKGYDFQKAEADWFPDDVAKLKGVEKSARVVELVGARNDELAELQDEYNAREKAENAAADLEKHDRTPVNRPKHGGPEEVKSFGQLITEHPVYKGWREGKPGIIELPNFGLSELKAVFITTSGWAPESTRTGRVVDAVTRPLQITDIMPSGRTGQANVVYMLETTRTHVAAEMNENAAHPEATFILSEQTSSVRKIGSSVPVTDEQLEDVAMVGSYLEGRLNFGVQQRLDQQIISGDGVPPNLDGIINVGGIQTLAKGAEPVPDTIFSMMQDIRVTGRAMPTHVVLHPNDWEPIRLLRTADGVYIWGNPSEAGPERIWGLPVVQNESLTVNTGLVGSFLLPWITLFERRGVIIERGFVNDDFLDGRQTIRASGRWAMVVYRPAAFGTVTGI